MSFQTAGAPLVLPAAHSHHMPAAKALHPPVGPDRLQRRRWTAATVHSAIPATGRRRRGRVWSFRGCGRRGWPASVSRDHGILRLGAEVKAGYSSLLRDYPGSSRSRETASRVSPALVSCFCSVRPDKRNRAGAFRTLVVKLAPSAAQVAGPLSLSRPDGSSAVSVPNQAARTAKLRSRPRRRRPASARRSRPARPRPALRWCARARAGPSRPRAPRSAAPRCGRPGRGRRPPPRRCR
jgi:hypothetical protein